MSISKKALGMGAALALSAAGMVGTTTTVYASGSGTDIHCYGVNKCGGHNDCKSASNACKGKAACKGQGYVKMSAAACDHIGGKVGD